MDGEWWRGAAIYQIYPAVFQDSDGDGIGDLRGITRRLPHVAALGVDAVWLSPIYRSPMVDMGYDVSDHRDIDPVFGSLADFDAMLAEAHRLGLRVDPRPGHQPRLARAPALRGEPAVARQPQGRLVRLGRPRGPTARRPTTGSRCSAARPGSGRRGGTSTTSTTS